MSSVNLIMNAQAIDPRWMHNSIQGLQSPTEPIRTPQSEQVMKRLEACLENTAKIIHGLESKLIPILAPKPCPTKQAQKDKESLTPLFERINACADQVASMNQALNELADSIEL